LVHGTGQALGAADVDSQQVQSPKMAGRPIRTIGACRRTVTGRRSLGYGSGFFCERYAAH